MAQKRERAIAGFFAALFIISTVTISIFGIVQAIQSHNNSAKEAAMEDSKLQGTKLRGFTPITDIPELKTEDTKPGTGAVIKQSDTITVDYTGAVASTGIIFESSKDSGQPATFPLAKVIPGWTKGIPGMKEGGTRRLLIPSTLAYGARGSGSIPPNSDLVFDVTVHKIAK